MYKLPPDLHKANAIFEQISGDRHEMRLFCQTMEECSELQVAILHLLRGRNNSEEVMSEIADVVICIDSLIEKYGGYEKLNKVLKEKSAKYLRQMKKASELSDEEITALSGDYFNYLGGAKPSPSTVSVYLLMTDFHGQFEGRMDKVRKLLKSLYGSNATERNIKWTRRPPPILGVQ